MNKVNLNNERRMRSKSAEGTRNRGWMAFDLEQRQKQQGSMSDDSLEEYPALGGPYPMRPILIKHRSQLEKPFSSVVGSSVQANAFVDAQEKTMVPGTNSYIDTARNADASQRLIDLHPWADKSFIQDVLAAAGEDLDEASRFLGEMLVSGNNHGDTSLASYGHDAMPFDVEDLSAKGKEDMNCNSHAGYETNESLASPLLTLDSFKPSIVEPESAWNQEDVYLLHRKEAIKMTRSASHLSKSANEAYLRGDHVAARQFSLKAQQQWNASRNLNAKAANEILTTRNFSNDIWRLDLHGLHAAEATAALKQRLETVESLHTQNKKATSNPFPSEPRTLNPPSEPSASPLRMNTREKQSLACRQRPRLLQVITGKGNHSQGPAALPSAVKSFLSENGYHFEERPGAIVIRPKFRH